MANSDSPGVSVRRLSEGASAGMTLEHTASGPGGLPRMVRPAPLPANGRGLAAAAARDAWERGRRETVSKKPTGTKSWMLLRNTVRLLAHAPTSTTKAPADSTAVNTQNNGSVKARAQTAHTAPTQATDAKTKATRVAWAVPKATDTFAALCPENAAALGAATAERNATYVIVKKARDELALFGDTLTGARTYTLCMPVYSLFASLSLSLSLSPYLFLLFLLFLLSLSLPLSRSLSLSLPLARSLARSLRLGSTP